MVSRAQQVDVQDRAYIMAAPIPASDFLNMYPGRKYLFDLGTASYPTSMAWLTQRYEKFGLHFDEIWAWEAGPTEAVRHDPGVYQAPNSTLLWGSHNICSNTHPCYFCKGGVHLIRSRAMLRSANLLGQICSTRSHMMPGGWRCRTVARSCPVWPLPQIHSQNILCFNTSTWSIARRLSLTRHHFPEIVALNPGVLPWLIRRM